MTATQTEAQLEDALIARLGGLGYERVTLTGSADLEANLKTQLEKHNEVALSDNEFTRVLAHLAKGNVFQKAERLRDRMQLSRDDGSTIWLRFLNTEHWCQNEYQVTHQVTMEGSYKNRYDVTLLINGLPLVQIELKRRGVELKEAFNQINRYHRHSYWGDSALFQYVQLFVISNGVNTKYYANNRHQDFKQTFFWADKDNTLITGLDPFADAFLEKCHVSKMICKYIVLNQGAKILMVLRPYQYYAVEAIIERVKSGRKHGYIWHTTGSGKTLTSFKAAQILVDIPKVEKVVFVVDRADLDYQTTKEFNHFSDGSVDGTDNTRALVGQLSGETKLIVTTIQKLNTAISRDRHSAALQEVKDKRVVFIFDECHRSQFGDTHKRITGFFSAAQMFGFTGTPIFADNSVRNEHGKRTTKDLFDLCLHQYVITNAIADENVLRFAIEYYGKLKKRDGSLIDENVAGINTKEFFENEDRISGVVDWIIANHDRKTHKRQFSSMLCVSSVDALLTYYETFKAKAAGGDHDLRVATIFSFAANEEDADANGEIGEPDLDAEPKSENKHTRDRLQACIEDYNGLYKTSHTTKDSKGFYTYYKDIAKRMKDRERKDFKDVDRLDILLVVNMFLTGFDAKKLNTLYVDKNLKHHGLIQAFSRTNRTLGQLKSHGNVVCFRNLKANTDEAIKLFSDKNPVETALVEPYENYRDKFNEAVAVLLAIAPTVESVDGLIDETDQLAFVKAFRALMRVRNILIGFSEYDPADLDLSPQAFEDYKSKYLDLYDRTKSKTEGEQVSIVDEVDFELELIQRDEVNVSYILQLLAAAKEDEESGDEEAKERAKQTTQSVLDMLGNEPQLRSKRDLIEKFIADHMPNLQPSQSVESEFETYWSAEREAALGALCEQENLSRDVVQKIIAEYTFTGRAPLAEQVHDAVIEKPRILERRTVLERVTDKILDLVNTFNDGV